MSVENISNLAELIAAKLLKIKELSTKKVSVKNKLDEVNRESNTLATEINKIEQEITSIKFEISNRLSDSNLKVVIDGE